MSGILVESMTLFGYAGCQIRIWADESEEYIPTPEVIGRKVAKYTAALNNWLVEIFAVEGNVRREIAMYLLQYDKKISAVEVLHNGCGMVVYRTEEFQDTDGVKRVLI